MNCWMVAVASVVLTTFAAGCSVGVTTAEKRSVRDDAQEASGNDDERPTADDKTTVADAPSPEDGAVKTVNATCTSKGGIEGSGEITRVTRRAAGFADIDMRLPGKLIVQEGSEFVVQVETDSNVQDLVVVDDDPQGGGLLVTGKGSFCINDLTVRVTMPRFHGVSMAAAGDADITKRSAASEVVLEMSGAGTIVFRGQATDLEIDVSGAGNVVLDDGSAQSTTVDVSGAGDVASRSFDAGKVTKSITGAGDVSL